MKVYVVVWLERYEGGGAVAVYTDYEKAKLRAGEEAAREPDHSDMTYWVDEYEVIE